MYVKDLPKRTSEDERVVALIIDTLRYQSHFEVLEGATDVDNGAAATSKHLAHVYHKKWRVVGIGFRGHTEAYAAGENPDMAFGISGDTDLFGKLILTFSGADLFAIGDVAMQQTRGFFGASVYANTCDAEVFTAGDPDGQSAWQTGYKAILATNISNLTQGQALPFVIIEIDRMGAN